MPAEQSELRDLLEAHSLDLETLRKICWHGIPDEHRAECWRLLLGYAPPIKARRSAVLQQKRLEYERLLEEHRDVLLKGDTATLHQIDIDLVRTFLEPQYSRLVLRRILFCWAIRRPASGYVQGLNDLLVPFIRVFCNGGELEGEADAYWCFTLFLEPLQDCYTEGQPGIHKLIARFRLVLGSLDLKLLHHLESRLELNPLHFAFRWMNCLLLREFPPNLHLHLFDAYQSSSNVLAEIHVFVCVGLVMRLAPRLSRIRDFSEALLLLQNMPTQDWKQQDLELLLSEAWLYRLWYRTHFPQTN